MSKQPSGPTIKRLFALSGNVCAFPGCVTPIIDPSSDVVIGEVCHIKAREEGGPRFDYNQTDDERNAFENLVLMCGVHHKIIDTDKDAYPVERLTEIKESHEQKHVHVAEPGDDVVSRLIHATYVLGSSINTVNQSGGQVAHLINNYLYQQDASAPITATAPAVTPLFTGRKDDLKELTSVLTSRRPVACTIHGMGGVGKTEVAKKLASVLRSNFPGGIFWGSISDHDGNPNPILHHWARLCARHLPSDLDANSLAHSVRGILSNWQVERGPIIVIIDDVREGWLDAARLLRIAIPDTGSLLTTARDEAMAKALDTETYPLEGMSPEESLEVLNIYAKPYDIESEMESAVSLIEVVGYLPLALELAGKRLALLSRKPGIHLNELLKAVRKRASEALMLPGHKGLAATFAITYESLSNYEQRLFRWLCVFAEGLLDLAGVAQVVGIDVTATESMLDHLVASSLLGWGDTNGRYKLHPLLRQYSEALLDESAGESEQARGSHLTYYQTLLDNNSNPSPAAHAVIEGSLQNILKAMEFAFESEKFESVSNIVLGLWADSLFLGLRGYMQLARALMQKAIVACQRIGDRIGECAHLSNLGNVYHELGMTSEAFKSWNEALEVSRRAGSRRTEAAVLNNLGLLNKDTGDIEGAMEHHQQAFNIASEINAPDIALDALANLGAIYRHVGDIIRARGLYETAISVARELGNKVAEGNSLSNLGLVYGDLMGAWGLAWTYIAQALQISKEIGDRKGEGNRLNHLANILLRFISPELAIEYFKESLKIAREIEHREHELTRLANLANVYRYLGEVDTAIDYYNEALAISIEINYPDHQGLCMVNLGITYRDLGQFERAKQYLEKAVELFRSTQSYQLKEAEELLSGLNNRA